MTKSGFSPSSKMLELLKEDSSFLLTITRFGFSLGFGEKTIREVCLEKKIDVNTFVSVVNFISSGYNVSSISPEGISIDTVVLYLKNAHEFFMKFKLPLIRNKLLDAITESFQEEPYKKMILKFFEDYVNEVRKHMDYENKTVFPYAQQLAKGHKEPGYSISVFEKNHENIDSKLSDLKNILIRYFPAYEPNYLLNEVLFDLSACEKDLERHNMVEDLLFVPYVENLERRISTKEGVVISGDKADSLTDREIEVLIGVIKGLTNKDIASNLFLSTHTIISHRRNIARKLEIHSTAGLTIYAIVNKLVSIEEIKSVIE